jgi:LacI family transcriptional regulator
VKEPTRSTIHDVAREAGVSIATVSKALNDRGRLSEATRRRVRVIAEEMAFLPSRLRQKPRTSRHLAIGVITADVYGRFTMPVILGAEDAFGPAQASIFMCDARDDPIREEFYLASFMERGVDGIMVTGKSNDTRPSLSALVPVPVIYVFQPSEDPADCSIVTSNRQVAGVAVEHFRAIGRRRIAHVTGPPGQDSVRDRHAGFVAALEAAGLHLAGEPLNGEWSERFGREAAARLVHSGIPFDGVFCASDQLGRGVITGLRELGLRVPEDVAVIGVDNWTVIAEAARPALTSIDLQLGDLGRAGARVLAAAVLGSPLPRGHLELPGVLVRRGSTDTTAPLE